MTALPRREQKRIERTRDILDGALKVFSEQGFSGATMDAVAGAAGITKPTLYQYFSSKQDLFKAMMAAERDDMLVSFGAPSAERMVEQLHDFAWAYADAVMRPELLSLARLIIGEAQRFPFVGEAYQQSGPDRVLEALMAYLTAQRDAGRLSFDDAELAAQDFWGLILSAPRTKALHEPENAPSKTEIARYVENGLKVFLKAYSTSPAKDLTSLQAVT